MSNPEPAGTTKRSRTRAKKVGDHEPDWLLLLGWQHPDVLAKGEGVYEAGGVRSDPSATGVYHVKSLDQTDMTWNTIKDGGERRVHLGDGWQSCDCPHGRKAGARGLLYCYHVAASLVAQDEERKRADG
jgi:hypothetical protein